MVRTICDRCGRELDTTGEKYDFFIKVLHYDFCPKCHGEFIVLLKEFTQNKIKEDYQNFVKSLKRKL